jgi:hypothetical protein
VTRHGLVQLASDAVIRPAHRPKPIGAKPGRAQRPVMMISSPS